MAADIAYNFSSVLSLFQSFSEKRRLKADSLPPSEKSDMFPSSMDEFRQFAVSFLSASRHSSKFSVPLMPELLADNIGNGALTLEEIVSGISAIRAVAEQISLYPWKEEVKHIDCYSGTYFYKIRKLSGHRKLLEKIGYTDMQDQFYLDASPYQEDIVSLECNIILLELECNMIDAVCSYNSSFSLSDALRCREKFIGDPVSCACQFVADDGRLSLIDNQSMSAKCNGKIIGESTYSIEKYPRLDSSREPRIVTSKNSSDYSHMQHKQYSLDYNFTDRVNNSSLNCQQNTMPEKYIQNGDVSFDKRYTMSKNAANDSNVYCNIPSVVDLSLTHSSTNSLPLMKSSSCLPRASEKVLAKDSTELHVYKKSKATYENVDLPVSRECSGTSHRWISGSSHNESHSQQSTDVSNRTHRPRYSCGDKFQVHGTSRASSTSAVSNRSSDQLGRKNRNGSDVNSVYNKPLREPVIHSNDTTNYPTTNRTHNRPLAAMKGTTDSTKLSSKTDLLPFTDCPHCKVRIDNNKWLGRACPVCDKTPDYVETSLPVGGKSCPRCKVVNEPNNTRHCSVCQSSLKKAGTYI